MIAPKPQDQKPKKKAAAREAEADDGFVTVEQCGVSLRIPVGGKMPLKAYLAFRDGDETGGIELLLGPEQWEELLAKDPTLDDMNQIGLKIQEFWGN
jgi:hypothetical protein